jgi:mannose-6-phosphate isomerase-like protein (cupin superfamily)
MKIMEAPLLVTPDTNKHYEFRKDITGIALVCVVVDAPIPPYSHPPIEEFYYIRSGRGLLTIDGEEKEVEKDMVVFIPAGCTHGIKPIKSKEKLSYLYFAHHLEEPCRHISK